MPIIIREIALRDRPKRSANINTSAYGDFWTSVRNGKASSPRGNLRLTRLTIRGIRIVRVLSVTPYNPA